jgi:dienelactone hydrolase
MKRPVEFYSEGVKLRGDISLPDDRQAGEKRAGVILCHGYTGVKDLYLPDTARVLTNQRYMVMTFDYKGWSESVGPRSRLSPYSRALDVQAAMTCLSLQPEVQADRLWLSGTSYGGATVCWVGAVGPRPKCIVSVVGVGHSARWMRIVRRPGGGRGKLLTLFWCRHTHYPPLHTSPSRGCRATELRLCTPA